ncbi:MAG: DUF72 domain-containing protein [Pseudomonadota bacterium]
MSPNIFVGTAGWSIPSQYRPDFPSPGSHLDRYATRFNAAEINSSFYRPHRRTTYERWAESVGPEFRFSVKLPKAISHDRRLSDCAPLLEGFAEQVAGLGKKLGALLVQLPPSLAFDLQTAATFFGSLRSSLHAPVACEPRHGSWFSEQAETLLRSYRIARVAADPSPVAGAEAPAGWDGLRYLRLHGSPVIYRAAYDETRLRDYIAMLASARGHADAWCIFDNTASMAAIGNALHFQRLTAGSSCLVGTPAASDR